MENEAETLKQLDRSGFPFQLRIEHEIRSTNTEHSWEVATREHPWRNPEANSSGFIDLVLRHNEFKGDRLIIECKRIKGDDSRQLQWLFLLPDTDSRETDKVSCVEVHAAPPTSSIHGGWQDHRIWEDVRVAPSSFQSQFCILSGDDPKRQPLLESLCANLLDSLDGLAGEEVSINKSQQLRSTKIFIFPAIVTNAKITICQFKSSDISLIDGTFDRKNVTLSEVPFIRFRKSLVTRFPEGKLRDLSEANRARERGVFIINSEGLIDFLKKWKVTSSSFAIEQYT